MTRQLTSAVRHKLLRSPHAKRPPHGRLRSSRLVVRKSSTDEMGVRQELADWCFRPYHGIGPPRGAAAPFYGKVNYGKIKTLYAVLQPTGSRKGKELCSEHSDSH